MDYETPLFYLVLTSFMGTVCDSERLNAKLNIESIITNSNIHSSVMFDNIRKLLGDPVLIIVSIALKPSEKDTFFQVPRPNYNFRGNIIK